MIIFRVGKILPMAARKRMLFYNVVTTVTIVDARRREVAPPPHFTPCRAACLAAWKILSFWASRGVAAGGRPIPAEEFQCHRRANLHLPPCSSAPYPPPVLEPDRRHVPGAVRDAMSRSWAANKSLPHAFRSAARSASSATAPSGGGPRCRAKPALKSALRAASDRECAVGRARASATAHCTSATQASSRARASAGVRVLGVRAQ